MSALINHFKTRYFEYKLITIESGIEPKYGWKLRARNGVTKFKCRSSYFGYPVASLEQTFRYYKSDSIDVSGMDTSNIIDASEAFMSSHIKHGVDLHMLNFEKLEFTINMFNIACIPKINMSNLYMPNLHNAYRMFDSCYVLSDLNLNGTRTSKLSAADAMFAWCNELTSLDIRGLKFDNDYSGKSIFGYSCDDMNIRIVLVSDKLLADILKSDYGFVVMDVRSKQININNIKKKLNILGDNRVCLLYRE